MRFNFIELVLICALGGAVAGVTVFYWNNRTVDPTVITQPTEHVYPAKVEMLQEKADHILSEFILREKEITHLQDKVYELEVLIVKNKKYISALETRVLLLEGGGDEEDTDSSN